MASGLLTDYLAHGNAADRPTTPDLYVAGIGLWWNDDTQRLDLWDGTAWLDDIASGGGGGGSGDVVGPSSSVNNRIAVFDGTTGKLIKDGGQTVAGLVAAARTPNVQAVASAPTVTPTASNDLVKVTAQAEALILANPSGTAVDGWGVVIRVKDNGTARAISYGTQYRPIGVTLPTTTVASKTAYLAGIWNAEDTTLDIVAVGQQA